MGNGVQEAILLLTAADFADKKNRIQHQPGNNQAEEEMPSTIGTTLRQLCMSHTMLR